MTNYRGLTYFQQINYETRMLAQHLVAGNADNVFMSRHMRSREQNSFTMFKSQLTDQYGPDKVRQMQNRATKLVMGETCRKHGGRYFTRRIA